MFLPLAMGSDETTDSVATGKQEFHPFYGSPGVISNIACRGHGSGVFPSDSERSDDFFKTLDYILNRFSVAKRHREAVAFRKFARQLYHICLAFVLSLSKKGMTTPVVMKCPDGIIDKSYMGWDHILPIILSMYVPFLSHHISF